MSREDSAALAAEIVAYIRKRHGVAPTLRTGVAESTADARGNLLVRIDGPDVPLGTQLDDTSTGSAEAQQVTVDTVTDDDINEAVYARAVGDVPALGQRVLVMATPAGALYCLGSPNGGTPRLLGGTRVPGDGTIADDTASAALSTEQPALLLSCDAVVPHVRHQVDIEIFAIVAATVNGTVGTGRVYREQIDLPDEESATGDTVQAVLVGTWLLDDLRNGTGRRYSSSVPDFPDPGVYRYYATLQVASGWTVRYGTTPASLTGAALTVRDGGAIGQDTTWPDDE